MLLRHWHSSFRCNLAWQARSSFHSVSCLSLIWDLYKLRAIDCGSRQNNSIWLFALCCHLFNFFKEAFLLWLTSVFVVFVLGNFPEALCGPLCRERCSTFPFVLFKSKTWVWFKLFFWIVLWGAKDLKKVVRFDCKYCPWNCYANMKKISISFWQGLVLWIVSEVLDFHRDDD